VGVYEPANGLGALLLEVVEDGVDEELAESGALVVVADGGDHEVAVFGEWSESFVLDAFVGGDSDDGVVVVGENDDLAVKVAAGGVVAPLE